MNTRHSRRISRNAAERLLDGHAGADSDLLTRVLAAAAAPARESELTGEQMAVAAFEAHHLVPVATPEKRHKSMLAKLLTIKVLVSSFAACATGGVALAASTGALTGSGSPGPTASASQPASSWSLPGTSASSAPRSTDSAQPTASADNPLGNPGATTGTQTQPADSAPAAPAAEPTTAQSLPQGATALCRALIGDVASLTGGAASNSSQSGQEQALSSSQVSRALKNREFSPLVSTAQSAAAVPDYCALLLDLPQLPQPSELAQLPGTLLGQLLTALPTSTLSQVLTSLPSSTLSQVLTALPTSALSQVLTSLPSSVLSQVLTALPASALSQVLTSLPNSVVSQLLNKLPTSTLTQLPSSVLSQLPSSVLSQLPSSVLPGLGL